MEAAGHPYSLEPQGYLSPDTGPCHPWAPSPHYGHQSPTDQAYFQYPPASVPHNCYGDTLVKVSGDHQNLGIGLLIFSVQFFGLCKSNPLDWMLA